MDRLQSMRVFQAVVDEGGFAAAARKLDLAPAVVTRLVTDLEQHLGVRLLQRTTRRLSLTDAGQAYLARLRSILGDIDEAHGAAQSHTHQMAGTLRILAPPVAAAHMVAPLVAGFRRLHPGVTFDIDVDDSPHPAVHEYDLAVLSGAVQVDADVIVRTIILSQAVFCASPAYLRRNGTPKQPQDLLQHQCLRLRTRGARLRPMTLIDPSRDDLAIELDLPAVMTANHTDTLLRAALDGAGISSQPVDLLAPLLKTGQLRRVLAPWITNRLSMVAALPSRKFMPLRTRAFVDYLVEQTRLAVAGLGRNAPPAPGGE
ncbi:LysR family transcriptional regulator [Caenimonas terrae]|uniref:LysR family transcriptional regulator n=1 Tax=Caenimonas terrae TaxID=696074 RepID=A0ABW0N851_9BURK